MQSFTTSSTTQQRPQTYCRAGEYLIEQLPQWKPLSEEELQIQMRLLGATDQTMQERIDNFNKCVDDFIKGFGGRPAVRSIGVSDYPVPRSWSCLMKLRLLQARPTERTEFSSIPIPNSDLVIRFWDGGMSQYRQFCLDFYDVRRGTHVPLPAGWELWPAVHNVPGTFTMSGPLMSWEQAMGVDPGPSGDEKWSVPEGAYITLVRGDRGGGENLTFVAPVRQAQRPANVLVPRPGF